MWSRVGGRRLRFETRRRRPLILQHSPGFQARSAVPRDIPTRRAIFRFEGSLFDASWSCSTRSSAKLTAASIQLRPRWTEYEQERHASKQPKGL
jgi:hypothetical protein